MKNYLERARKLLEASKADVNPFDVFTPTEPHGVFLHPGQPIFDEMEAIGVKELNKTCFVIIAGGLGERLGYSGIKLSLPVCLI